MSWIGRNQKSTSSKTKSDEDGYTTYRIIPDIVDFEIRMNSATGDEIVVLKFECKNSKDKWCVVFDRKGFDTVIRSLWSTWNDPSI